MKSFLIKNKYMIYEGVVPPNNKIVNYHVFDNNFYSGKENKKIITSYFCQYTAFKKSYKGFVSLNESAKVFPFVYTKSMCSLKDLIDQVVLSYIPSSMYSSANLYGSKPKIVIVSEEFPQIKIIERIKAPYWHLVVSLLSFEDQEKALDSLPDS